MNSQSKSNKQLSKSECFADYYYSTLHKLISISIFDCRDDNNDEKVKKIMDFIAKNFPGSTLKYEHAIERGLSRGSYDFLCL